MNPDRPAPQSLADPSGTSQGAGGELNAVIARSVVQIYRSVAGRGPTKAKAFFRDNVVVVVMYETQTRAERSLVANGQADAVRDLRRGLQTAVCTELVDMVEKLTGCSVTAFLSQTHIDPDISVEVFILDHSLPYADMPVIVEPPARKSRS